MNSFLQDQLRDYSAVFSRNAAMSWLKSNFQSIDQKIRRYDNDWILNSNITYSAYLKYIYGVLEENYPTEYIIKNNFLTEWLIPEIGKDKSVVFNEFRVGNSIADLVHFNGKSRAFEIKTEFDSDARLELQLANYKKAFNELFVIIPESKILNYYKYDKSIGLITYNFKQAPKFRLVRQSQANSFVDPNTIMQILHTHEYKSVVKAHYRSIPHMTSFDQFEKCFHLINSIPNDILNTLFISQMKKRNKSLVLSSRYYKELNQIVLSLRLSKVSKQILINNLNTALKYN